MYSLLLHPRMLSTRSAHSFTFLNGRGLVKRLLVVLSIIASLAGCVAPQSSLQGFDSKEMLLLETKNYAKLILLYKEALGSKEDTAIRLKLADAYLKSGDAESALFIVTPLVEGDTPPLEGLLILAHSEYELGHLERALVTANQANELQGANAEVENLLGVIHAAKHDYVASRGYFNLARLHLYDDVKVKNNLAVLDIIEGKYRDAVQKLLPVYLNDQGDKQVEANLLLAMAKLDNYGYVHSILADRYTDREIADKFQALKGIKTVTTQETEFWSSANSIPVH